MFAFCCQLRASCLPLCSNAKKEELLDREENLLAQQRVSGRALAGGERPKEQTEDEKWAEDAKKRYEGTGMDPTE